MVRALTSLAALILAGSALAQGFGRFGYTQKISVPGLQLGADGFSAKGPSADRFRFVKSAKQWKPIQTTELGQTILLSQFHACPSKMRVSLVSPGASYYFPDTLQLKLASTGAPFLSWHAGTVGADVPTPDTNWILVSFKESQPPVLLVFLDGPQSVRMVGKAGDWTLTTDKPFKGWVRVVTPFGSEAANAVSAAGLGQLCDRVAKNEVLWTQPEPKLTGVELDSHPHGALWRRIPKSEINHRVHRFEKQALIS